MKIFSKKIMVLKLNDTRYMVLEKSYVFGMCYDTASIDNFCCTCNPVKPYYFHEEEPALYTQKRWVELYKFKEDQKKKKKLPPEIINEIEL